MIQGVTGNTCYHPDDTPDHCSIRADLLDGLCDDVGEPACTVEEEANLVEEEVETVVTRTEDMANRAWPW